MFWRYCYRAGRGLLEDALYFTAVAVVAGASLRVVPWLTLIAVGLSLFAALGTRNAVAGIVRGF